MRRTRLFVCLSFIVLLLAVADLFFGAISLPCDELLQTFLGEPPSEFLRNIFWEYRFPKMLTALLVGMALPTSGLLMQRFFRNPLAGPFVLGISSGATLGAACAIMISGVGGMLGVFTIAGAATLGALAILLLILVAAIRLQGQNTILILGILLSALALGVVNVLQYTSNERALKLFVIWTMGSLSEVSGTSLLFLALGTLLGLVLAFLCLRPLSLLQLGATHATSLGLSLRTTTLLLFLATALLAGITTAFCGPIGFIGLVVPHIARQMFHTSSLKTLFVATLLIGMVSLLAVDLLSQYIGRWMPLPLNALVAIVCLPFMIHLLFSAKSSHALY